MKKRLTIIGIALLLSKSLVFSQIQESKDAFWLINLGSSIETIKEMENQNKYIEKDSSLIYTTKFLGIKGETTYEFQNDSLIRKSFIVIFKNTNSIKKPLVMIESYLATHSKLIEEDANEDTPFLAAKKFKYNNSLYDLLAYPVRSSAALTITCTFYKEE
jgi:hypothetical protein